MISFFVDDKDLYITLRLRQDGPHFSDDIFKFILVHGNVSIFIYISLKYVSNDWIDNKQALVQIMAWCWPDDKPLSEPMMKPI